MHVVAEREVEDLLAADVIKHLGRLAQILAAVQVNASRCGDLRTGWWRTVVYIAVATTLAANMPDALRAVAFDVVARLIQVAAVGVTLDEHAFAALAARQLAQRRSCHLVLDVPQRHVHAR